jgi:hypothetical protein
MFHNLIWKYIVHIDIWKLFWTWFLIQRKTYFFICALSIYTALTMSIINLLGHFP